MKTYGEHPCVVCSQTFTRRSPGHVVCDDPECKKTWQWRERICPTCKVNVVRGRGQCAECALRAAHAKYGRKESRDLCGECGVKRTYRDGGSTLLCQICMERNEYSVGGTVWCHDCSRRLPFENFTPAGLKNTWTQCRECNRFKYMWTYYRVSPEMFYSMVADQNECCGICKDRLGPSPHSWDIDHDHSCCSGRKSCGQCVRGLLCKSCNVGVLGGAKDNVEVLMAAVQYLTDWESNRYAAIAFGDGSEVTLPVAELKLV